MSLHNNRGLSGIAVTGLRPDRDFDALAEGVEELEESLDGEISRAATHEGRDMWLLNPEDFAGLSLS